MLGGLEVGDIGGELIGEPMPPESRSVGENWLVGYLWLIKIKIYINKSQQKT